MWSRFSFWVVCINNKYRATLRIKLTSQSLWGWRKWRMYSTDSRIPPLVQDSLYGADAVVCFPMLSFFLMICHIFFLSCWLWFSLITVICVSINSLSYLCVRRPFVSQILIMMPCEPSFQESGSLTADAHGGLWPPASSYWNLAEIALKCGLKEKPLCWLFQVGALKF